jgi:hypothetical protein
MFGDILLLTRQEIWLQQDGTPHFGRHVTAVGLAEVVQLLGQQGHQIFHLGTTFCGVT